MGGPATTENRVGHVVGVRGSVVDVVMDPPLPELGTLLQAADAPSGGAVEEAAHGQRSGVGIAVEVVSHLDDETVRTVALTPTQGLARGDELVDSGAPITVGVGDATRGRTFNVFGQPIDGLGDDDLAELERRTSVFCGIGERNREAEELHRELTESGVLEQSVLVFGQMDEQPGARLRVGHTALTMAEYFRDDRQQDVLLLIDNIFRFVQAGTEVSALLG